MYVCQKQQKSSGALLCPEGGSVGTEGKESKAPLRVRVALEASPLKHVQDGVVHLDQYSQVDRQAGLAVLRGRRARQP